MAHRVPRGVTSATDRIVGVSNLTKSFGDHVVLDNVDLAVGEFEFVALLGRSGGGKSTFLRILEGLDRDYAGTVLVPAERSVVFQEPRLLPWKRVWQNVVVGLTGRSATELRVLADTALAEVGLTGKADSWPRTLSGGEAQRVGLARALVRQPRLILLDEPFGALDALTRIRMHALLVDLVARHRPGVVLVTHDVREALVLADRVVVLDNGHFVYDARIAEDRQGPDAEAVLERRRLEILEALGVTAEETRAADGSLTADPT